MIKKTSNNNLRNKTYLLNNNKFHRPYTCMYLIFSNPKLPSDRSIPIYMGAHVYARSGLDQRSPTFSDSRTTSSTFSD